MVDKKRPSAPPAGSALDAETLRPLVEVAYWSPFVEVKRDAAAAFATLASNPRNLGAMSEAGVLGALLALVGLNDESSRDSRTQRSAAVALSHLARVEGVKLRLLKAPDGLNSLFFLAESPHVPVKRAAAQAIDMLCTHDEAKQAVVAAGGIQCIFNLSTSRDKPLCRLAARICRRLALFEGNREALAESPLLRHGMILLMQTADMAVKRDLVDFFYHLSASTDTQERLVDAGLLHPLAVHMDLAVVSADVALLVMRCLARLALHPHNRPIVVEEECIPQLCKLVFHELPLALAQDPALLNAATKAAARSSAAAADRRAGGAGAGRVRPPAEAPRRGRPGRGAARGRRLVSVGTAAAGAADSPAGGGESSGALAAARARLEAGSAVVRVPVLAPVVGDGAASPHAGIPLFPETVPTVRTAANRRFAGMMAPEGLPPGLLVSEKGAEHRRMCFSILADVAGCEEARDSLVSQGCLAPLLEDCVVRSPQRRVRRAACEVIALLARSGAEETEQLANARRQRMYEAGAAPAIAHSLRDGEEPQMRALAVEALALLSRCPATRRGFVDLGCVPDLLQLCGVKGDDMAVHAAAALANLCEEEANKPRLLQYGVLTALIPLTAPRQHRAAARVQGVRAVAALSSCAEAREVIVETGALGFLHAIRRSSGSEHVKVFARLALANLRMDSAALHVQMAYRGFKARREFRRRVQRRRTEHENMIRIKAENEEKLRRYAGAASGVDAPRRDSRHRVSTTDIAGEDSTRTGASMDGGEDDDDASSLGSVPRAVPSLHLSGMDSTASLHRTASGGGDSPGRRRRSVMQPAHPLMQGRGSPPASPGRRPGMLLQRRESGGMVLVPREEVEAADRREREREARLARAREEARRARERELANATPRTRQRRRRASIVHGGSSRPLLDDSDGEGPGKQGLESLEALVESMMHSTPAASPAVRAKPSDVGSVDSRASQSPVPISAVPPHVFE